jgi:predicted amidohydrolase
VEPIVEACAQAGSSALVGAPVQGEAGRPHIAMVAIDGTVAYLKMWLGMTESNRFTPGSKPAVLEVDGWRLGLAICKDSGIWTCDGVLVAQAGPETGATTHATLS